MSETDWDRPLERPVIRPNGKKVVTLLDAYKVLLELPKAKQKEPMPQALAQVLIGAAEGREPMHTAQAAAAIIVNGPREDRQPKRKKPARKYKVVS